MKKYVARHAPPAKCEKYAPSTSAHLSLRDRFGISAIVLPLPCAALVALLYSRHPGISSTDNLIDAAHHACINNADNKKSFQQISTRRHEPRYYPPSSALLNLVSWPRGPHHNIRYPHSNVFLHQGTPVLHTVST